MAYGTLAVDTLNSSTGVLASNNGMTGIAKAWVAYNSSAQTITSSFNVSSVTYAATGTFTVNFNTAMSNANYIPVGTCVSYNSGESGFVLTVAGTYNVGPALKTTSQCQFETGLSRTTSLQDNVGVYIAIFGV